MLLLPDALTPERRPLSCWSFWMLAVLLVLLVSLELTRHRAEAASLYRTADPYALRLCSRNLSDALFLICKERGFNNPFIGFLTGEVQYPEGVSRSMFRSGSSAGAGAAAAAAADPAIAALLLGNGLVEECCYHSCSFEQMEHYCKTPEQIRAELKAAESKATELKVKAAQGQ